jgi:hypothetical protein
MTERRFPPPWTVEKITGGLKVCDAKGQSLAYVYSRKHPADAGTAGVLTEDEARRIASNIAKLPELLASKFSSAFYHLLIFAAEPSMSGGKDEVAIFASKTLRCCYVGKRMLELRPCGASGYVFVELGRCR